MNKKFPTYKNIENYFYNNFNLVYQHNDDLEKYFIKHSSNYNYIFENIYTIEPIYLEWKNYKFPVFIHQNNTQLHTKNGQISFDIFLNVFLFLSGWQEKICKTKDVHNRFPFKESLQYKFDFVEIPIVNIYFELLYEVALKKDCKIVRKLFENDFVFTHDIDQLRSGWFENIQFYKQIKSLINFWEITKNLATKLLGLKDDYYLGMEKMIAIDKKFNIKAISFFIPEKSAKDADFYLENPKFLKILKQTKKTQEIGIHPGYETYNNETDYKKQLKKLEKLSGQKITKSRQHFLRYDINITPFIQEKLNIKEDYTLGFAEHLGFRNGIANPFFLFNFKTNKAFSLKQIPLVFMDVSLTNYNLDKDFEEIILILKKIKIDFNCHFSILFHNSVFSDSKYKGFEDFYKRLISL